MKPRELKKGIYCVGAVDWDRRLFDCLIPLPDGTSYNAYLVQGSEKTALIDSVDPPMHNILQDNLDELGVQNLDYVVAHHAEQDHSGSIPKVMAKYPGAKVICSPKCRDMLIDHLMVPGDRIITANDKETVSLGDRTLEFLHTPWVHWPETMVTYLKEDRILFSCDFFGSHLATTDMFVTDEGQLYEAAKRYFAEIMMPFRPTIQKNLEKVKEYDIEIIAPSHGPMHNKPSFIMDAYQSWLFDEPKNIVVLPYVSMHGSTGRMVEYLVTALAEKGVTVKQFDLTVTDIGKLAMSLVDAATVVLGVPTIHAGPHPVVAYAAFLANALRPNIKFVSIIGSFGWGQRTVEVLAGMIPNLKVEVIDPVLCKGFPKEADFEALDRLAAAITEKHKANNYI
ncbi:MAG: FprA family A-type flavoprotein [Dehalococcoidales bacterium]|nr:MAG: FprA family A-type flavoprotein [Dehalococcoidales bacterium]